MNEKPKTNLPAYAFEYSHPSAQRGDVGAEFRGDDNGSICVSLEVMEAGMVNLNMHRSGIDESCFTRGELAKLIELLTILYAANGKQPKRG